MALRLLELCDERDSAAVCRLAGRALADPNLRGWAAVLRGVPERKVAAREAVHASGVRLLEGDAGVLLVGTLTSLWHAGRELGSLDSEWKTFGIELARRAAAAETPAPASAALPGAPARTLVMGIVNVTPDSFSDGGRFLDPRAAIEQGLRLVEEGADLLDVGGEATNPFGAGPVSAAEELERVLPVVAGLAGRAPHGLSIDTRKVEVAAAALDSGATFVNDVSGLRDEALAKLVGWRKVPACLMHMRGEPQDMQSRATYVDVAGEVLDELGASLARAVSLGVNEAQTFLDPGIGFAKTAPQNVHLLGHLRELAQLGRPLLVGASRKSFIGALTGRRPSERLHGSIAAAVACALAGVAVVRVHDVAAAREALAVADALRGGGDGGSAWTPA